MRWRAPPWFICWEMPPRGHFSYKFVRWRGFPGPPAGKRPPEASFGIDLYAGRLSLRGLLRNGPQSHFWYRFVRWRGFLWAITVFGFAGGMVAELSSVSLIGISHRRGISYRYLIPDTNSTKKQMGRFFIGAETLCSYEKWRVCFLVFVFSPCEIK